MLRTARGATIPVLAILATVCLTGRLSAVRPPRALYGVRTDGSSLRELAALGTKAVVLFFVATDCPISSRSFPEMLRIRQEYASHAVKVWFVYPNEGERAATVREHQRSFDAAEAAFGDDALLDRDGALTQLTGARVTPSVAVLVPRQAGWAPVYMGRIDDRYVRLGVERPAIQNHFAERVVAEVLGGHKVEPATGTPVGCAIVRPRLMASSVTASSVTASSMVVSLPEPPR